MAAGLGFKDFTTGEVLTANDVDGYLMQGIWVFASAAARSSAVTSPQEGNYSFLKDTNSTEYYDGAAWVAAGGGGGGKVLQVVGSTYATATTIASTTMTDSGLSLSITPTLNTSKILILVSQTSFSSRSTYAVASGYRLMRGATSIWEITNDAQSLETYNTETNKITTFNSIAYLDSPATTSATTYKTQGRAGTTANSGQVVFQRGDYPSSIVLLEIGA